MNNPFENSNQEEHMLRHQVRAKDVPVGMIFWTGYEDFNYQEEVREHRMLEGLMHDMPNFGVDDRFPIDPESIVYVNHPEKCVPVPDRIVDESIGGKLHLKGTYKYDMVVFDRKGPYRPGLVFDVNGYEFQPGEREERDLLDLLLARAAKPPITRDREEDFREVYISELKPGQVFWVLKTDWRHARDTTWNMKLDGSGEMKSGLVRNAVNANGMMWNIGNLLGNGKVVVEDGYVPRGKDKTRFNEDPKVQTRFEILELTARLLALESGRTEQEVWETVLAMSEKQRQVRESEAGHE